MWNKSIMGHCFGEANPHDDFRRLVALYQCGALKLDDMVTTFYSLDEVNEGFAAMHAGTNVRGVIRYK
jgi:Zn-dependent alcohol dehydrogenase